MAYYLLQYAVAFPLILSITFQQLTSWSPWSAHARRALPSTSYLLATKAPAVIQTKLNYKHPLLIFYIVVCSLLAGHHGLLPSSSPPAYLLAIMAFCPHLLQQLTCRPSWPSPLIFSSSLLAGHHGLLPSSSPPAYLLAMAFCPYRIFCLQQLTCWYTHTADHGLLPLSYFFAFNSLPVGTHTQCWSWPSALIVSASFNSLPVGTHTLLIMAICPYRICRLQQPTCWLPWSAHAQWALPSTSYLLATKAPSPYLQHCRLQLTCWSPWSAHAQWALPGAGLTRLQGWGTVE